MKLAKPQKGTTMETMGRVLGFGVYTVPLRLPAKVP